MSTIEEKRKVIAGKVMGWEIEHLKSGSAVYIDPKLKADGKSLSAYIKGMVENFAPDKYEADCMAMWDKVAPGRQKKIEYLQLDGGITMAQIDYGMGSCCVFDKDRKQAMVDCVYEALKERSRGDE